MPDLNRLACPLLACSLVLAACRDTTTPNADQTAAVGGKTASVCPDICPPIGPIHDGTGVGTIAFVPGDPSPSAPGIWLGNIYSAQACYRDWNPLITDADNDWLDDECEVQLARAFAPALAISLGDGCPEGEPYWAAKYFDDRGFGYGAFVRIAYMPSYYEDCGNNAYGVGTGHAGDSEFLMLAVQFNWGTRHWELREAYLSAHAGAFNNASDYVRIPTDLQYPVRQLAYPQIWIAKFKHGNYRTQSECNSRAIFNDTCSDNAVLGRMLVYRSRNVGSRFVDNFPAGVLSDDSFLRNVIGRREYFYNSHPFGGWQSAATGVTPYASFLGSYGYEKYDYSYTFQGGTWYLGPGPGTPCCTYVWAIFDGPSTVVAYQNATWVSFVTGGNQPYRAEWWRKYASASAATLVGTSTGTGLTAGNYTGATDRCENFRLTLKVWTATNVLATRDADVSVTCPPPPLSLSINGPSVITAKFSYTFTAVTSGFTSPTYHWSERFCTSATSCGSWVPLNYGSSMVRVLSVDCSGTGQANYQIFLTVVSSDGRQASAQKTTSLCEQ